MPDGKTPYVQRIKHNQRRPAEQQRGPSHASLPYSTLAGEIATVWTLMSISNGACIIGHSGIFCTITTRGIYESNPSQRRGKKAQADMCYVRQIAVHHFFFLRFLTFRSSGLSLNVSHCQVTQVTHTRSLREKWSAYRSYSSNITVNKKKGLVPRCP